MINLTPEELLEIEQMFETLEVPDYNSYGEWNVNWDYNILPVITCYHEWKKEHFFSANVYETCKKCGAKKEEL
jgi:hypothetical protein